MPLSISDNFSCSKVYLTDVNMTHFCFPLIRFYMVYLIPLLYFQPGYIIVFEVSFLQTAELSHIFKFVTWQQIPNAINIMSQFLPSKPKIKPHDSTDNQVTLEHMLSACTSVQHICQISLDSMLNKRVIFPRPPLDPH